MLSRFHVSAFNFLSASIGWKNNAASLNVKQPSHTRGSDAHNLVAVQGSPVTPVTWCLLMTSSSLPRCFVSISRLSSRLKVSYSLARVPLNTFPLVARSARSRSNKLTVASFSRFYCALSVMPPTSPLIYSVNRFFSQRIVHSRIVPRSNDPTIRKWTISSPAVRQY